MNIEPKQKKRIAYTAIIGAVIAIVCHFVPEHYKVACNLVATICNGGL